MEEVQCAPLNGGAAMMASTDLVEKVQQQDSLIQKLRGDVLAAGINAATQALQRDKMAAQLNLAKTQVADLLDTVRRFEDLRKGYVCLLLEKGLTAEAEKFKRLWDKASRKPRLKPEQGLAFGQNGQQTKAAGA